MISIIVSLAAIAIIFVILANSGLTTQTLRANGGWVKVIQGGAPDWELYTEERKVSTDSSVTPGDFVSCGSETDGEVRLAASGDGDIGGIEQVLYRIGVKPQDIDTEIAAGSYVKTLRCTGGGGRRRFLVGAILSDGTAEVRGTLLELDATGHLKRYTYAGDASIFDAVAVLAQAQADVASTDRAVLVWV
jgi:hypothetical protein